MAKLSKKDLGRINSIIKKNLTKADFLSQQFKYHVSTAVIAAFSFVIAFAWKDLVTYFVENFVTKHLRANIPYAPDLIGAFVITIIAILGILIVSKWAQRPAEGTQPQSSQSIS